MHQHIATSSVTTHRLPPPPCDSPPEQQTLTSVGSGGPPLPVCRPAVLVTSAPLPGDDRCWRSHTSGCFCCLRNRGRLRGYGGTRGGLRAHAHFSLPARQRISPAVAVFGALCAVDGGPLCAAGKLVYRRHAPGAALRKLSPSHIVVDMSLGRRRRCRVSCEAHGFQPRPAVRFSRPPRRPFPS